MNTKYISSSVLKTSEFLSSVQHEWKFRCFQLTRWYILNLLKKSKFSFSLILFRRFTVHQFTMLACFKSKIRQRSIYDKIPGPILSHWDLQIKRNLFSVKMRDNWRHKTLLTLRNIGYMHCRTHWSGRCCNELFWYHHVSHVLTKKMPTHTWCFCSQIWKL